VSFSINTNIASMQAQEYLRATTEFQGKTINRVTSGLRIISSGDDAAGLAIANSYRSDQAVLTQGIRNANDGLATLQTIDSGMNNIAKLLDRGRTLAAQSASGTFTGDRSVLSDEFKSVMGEIDRQAQAIGLSQGGDFARNISVFVGGGRGADGDKTITNGSVSVNLTSSTVDSRSLGLSSYAVTGGADLNVQTTFDTAKASATTMSVNFSGAGFNDMAVTVNLNGVNDLNGLVTAFNEGIAATAAGGGAANTAFKNANITAALSEDGKSFTLNSADAAFSVEEVGGAGAARNFLGTTAGAQVKVAGGLESKELDYAAIVATDGGTGTTQKITISTTDADGAIQSLDITLQGLTDNTTALTAEAASQQINTALQGSGVDVLKKLVAAESGAGTDKITLAGLNDFKITVHHNSIGAANATGIGNAEKGTTVASAEVSGGSNVSILNETSAKQAVTKLAEAVTKLGQAQAVVGKGQNQFNFAVSLASTQLTNLAASESRIRDADLALEAANLTKAQILQQAGVAALAQANSAPQAVLSLLRG
jgi:flagellin